MGERKWSSIGVSLRNACYLAVLFYIGVFLANLTLLVKDRSWQDNSDKLWVRWHWVDISISGVSILAALLLLLAIIKNNSRLLAVFIVWAIVCIILSIVILAFGFGEYKREEIVARCIGIVITAYFLDVIFSYYLNLKNAALDESRRSSSDQSFTLEPSLVYPPESMSNGGFKNEFTSSTESIGTRNVKLWYEDTKM